MAIDTDWSAEENALLVQGAYKILADAGRRAEVRDGLTKAIDRTRSSIEYKLQNVSSILDDKGGPWIPGYKPMDHRQESLVPEVVRRGVENGVLPTGTPAFDVMAIYAGRDAVTNLERGLESRTWGFPRWLPVFQAQPEIGLVIIGTNSSTAGPRVASDVWQRGTIDLFVCSFIGPFVEGSGPHWEDEIAENRVKYPCRFGIRPLAFHAGVSLGPDGPLGADVSDALRRSGTTRGLGKLVVRAPQVGELAPEAPSAGSPGVVDMNVDPPSAIAKRKGGRGAGRMSDPAARRAVELRAMDAVEEWLGDEWHCKDTSSNHPWDFEASNGTEVMRIEVKGTTGVGAQVILTVGEVRNALEYPDCALAVVSNIQLDTSGAEPKATGGEVKFIRPWEVDQDALRPLTYEYLVPVG